MTKPFSPTPGPWIVNLGSSDCGECKLSVETSEGYFIAQADEGMCQEDNAALIAAAPDMFKALQWLLNNPGAHPANVWAVANEALSSLPLPERKSPFL